MTYQLIQHRSTNTENKGFEYKVIALIDGSNPHAVIACAESLGVKAWPGHTLQASPILPIDKQLRLRDAVPYIMQEVE